MSSQAVATPEAIQRFNADIERHHLAALWNVAARLMPKEPEPRIQPYLWRWSDMGSDPNILTLFPVATSNVVINRINQHLVEEKNYILRELGFFGFGSDIFNYPS